MSFVVKRSMIFMHCFFVLYVLVMMFFCGCGRSENTGAAQGNAIAEECKSFLNAPTSAKGRAELDRKIKVAVQTAGDWHVRSEIVRSMVDIILVGVALCAYVVGIAATKCGCIPRFGMA